MNKLTLTFYALERFVSARWKALMPLVVYLASELAHSQLDWSTPSGRQAAVMAVVSAILVYLKSNRVT